MFNPKEHLMNLKGKEYLQVMWRLVWFREDHPDWCIDTDLVSHADNTAVFCAKIYDHDHVQMASGYGSEAVKDFRDYLEKAETKAIGRALAMLGYGTQFAPELDEGDRIVDSPVPPKAPTPQEEYEFFCEDCGLPIADFTDPNGKIVKAAQIVARSKKKFGRCLCVLCGTKANNAQTQKSEDENVDNALRQVMAAEKRELRSILDV